MPVTVVGCGPITSNLHLLPSVQRPSCAKQDCNSL
jgi:hypothetical protein